MIKIHNVHLDNGWHAKFEYKGEYRMGGDYWDLILTNSNNESEVIDYFKDKIVTVGDYKGNIAKECIKTSKYGEWGILNTSTSYQWIINFKYLQIAPLRIYMHHKYNGKTVSIYEQPAFKGVQEYINIDNTYYLTFPLTSQKVLDVRLEEYYKIRRKQIEEVYFNEKNI